MVFHYNWWTAPLGVVVLQSEKFCYIMICVRHKPNIMPQWLDRLDCCKWIDLLTKTRPDSFLTLHFQLQSWNLSEVCFKNDLVPPNHYGGKHLQPRKAEPSRTELWKRKHLPEANMLTATGKRLARMLPIKDEISGCYRTPTSFN